LALGDDLSGQCLGPKSFVKAGKDASVMLNDNSNYNDIKPNPNPNINPPIIKILKLAAGVRHSAAITVDGGLIVWGTGSAAKIQVPNTNTNPNPKKQVSSNNDRNVIDNDDSNKNRINDCNNKNLNNNIDHNSSNIENDTTNPNPNPNPELAKESDTWYPPDGSKLIDIACGLHQTISIDDRGRVWSFGDDRFGSLGRPLIHPFSVINTEQTLGSKDIANLNPRDLSSNDTIDTDNTTTKVMTKKERRDMERDSIPSRVIGLEEGVRWQRVYLFS
jgi:alpha-tubulin suppressor-like RCC1 family protein